MSRLPDNGVTSYNGFVFPVETETVDASIKPQWDQAGRTIVFSEISITLKTIIAGRSIDPAVQTVVSKLTQPACPFVYVGRGLPLSINLSSVRDVAWGPKPELLNFRPLGGGNACELTWRVTVRIPTCPGAKTAFAPMEFNFTLSFEIQPNGYTVREYSGFVRIPATRITPISRDLPDSADYYREQINPPLQPKFRREPGQFSLSPDKCTLTFSIRDVQLYPNAPPPGMIEADAEQTWATVPGQLRRWSSTISATYEVAAGTNYTWEDARDAFFALVKTRVNFTLSKLGNAATLTAGGSSAKSNVGAAVIPVAFSMSEPNLYGPLKCKY